MVILHHVHHLKMYVCVCGSSLMMMMMMMMMMMIVHFLTQLCYEWAMINSNPNSIGIS